ncbi:DUF4136 domain-containing protein [Novosphingobium beihaiensis]|uniref:DUF4136 domain-containing protein n=1 Tax=Novosphingobium beihaiensis TaxID=2930389 RepID=A0ABT0BKD0_9SPHN|nr:DUF4136 domain-containing protein [Novosphingobium beihaiensis]MCJ2185423.1 DUF4136 domain-containing protein [Novosphingobium beihaiensis]
MKLPRFAHFTGAYFTGALALAASAALSGCVAPVGPVEVTRFHAADITPLGHGTIRVEPAPGQLDDMEFRAYAGAVGRELTRLGYTLPLPGESGSGQVALLSLERHRYLPQRNSNPVSVGVGGSTGSYGSGVGVGVGIDLSGPPPEQVETKLAVTIQDRASGRHLWEGRAAFTVRASSPMAQTSLGAAKMAEALFKGFPGQSGETILVK